MGMCGRNRGWFGKVKTDILASNREEFNQVETFEKEIEFGHLSRIAGALNRCPIPG